MSLEEFLASDSNPSEVLDKWVTDSGNREVFKVTEGTISISEDCGIEVELIDGESKWFDFPEDFEDVKEIFWFLGHELEYE